MIKAIVSGPAGRMGGRIIHLLEAEAGITLAGACEQPDHAAVGKDIGEVVGLPAKGLTVADSLGPSLAGGGGGHRVHPPRAVAWHHLKQVADRRQSHGPGDHGVFPGPDRRDPRPGFPDPSGIRPQHERRGELDVHSGGRRRPGARGRLRRRDHRGPPPPEKGRAQRHRAQSWPRSSPTPWSGTWRRSESMPAGASSANAARRRSASRRCEPGISSGSTPCSSGASARGWRSSTGPTAGTTSPGALKAAQWVVAQPPACYDMQDVLGLK